MDRILHLAAWWLSVTAVTLHQCAASPTESPSIRFSVAPTCLHTTCLLQKDNKGGCFRRREGSGHCASSIWPRCSVNGSAECHTQRRIDGSKILYCVHSDTTSQQRASRAKLGREDARQTSIYFRQKIPNIIFSEMNSSLFFPPLAQGQRRRRHGGKLWKHLHVWKTVQQPTSRMWDWSHLNVALIVWLTT